MFSLTIIHARYVKERESVWKLLVAKYGEKKYLPHVNLSE